MNSQETYYRRIVSSIGFAMLIFALLFEVFGVFVYYISPYILQLLFPSNAVVYDVAFQILYAAGYLLCFMLPVLFLKLFIRKAGYSYQSMNSPLRVSPWLPLMLLSCITIIFASAYLNSYLMELIGYSSDAFMQDSTPSADPAAYQIVLEFLVMCLVPGFCEEFLFRGAILTNCLPFGRVNAVIISSLLFSLMHRNGAQIFYAFVAGILLGIIYERTGSIWNCVIIHTVNNFISTAEGTVLYRIKSEILAAVSVNLLEMIVFLLGTLSTVILILKFFSHKDTRILDGVFGKNLPACDDYAAYPILPKRAIRLFLAPSMLIFLILCALQIGSLLLISFFGGLI